MSTVLIPQPLYNPAPYVAYGTNPGHCFHTPILVNEYAGTAYDATDIRSYAASEYCGKLILYTSCVYSDSIAVIYPPSASPHAAVAYGGACYSYSGTISTPGTSTVTLVGSVSPVSDCYDPICTGADVSGDSYVYNFPSQSLRVAVEFPHLDRGIARWGVAPAAQDTPAATPLPGRAMASIRKPLTYLTTITGTGQVVLSMASTAYPKDVLIERGGAFVSTLSLGVSTTTANLSVQDGDKLWLRVEASTGRVPAAAAGKVFALSWEPVLALPKLYDTGTLTAGGTVQALGFCGLTPYQDYIFYGTLPVDTVSDHPINPASLVTLQGAAGPEYLVIRNRGSGMQTPEAQWPWYAGFSLAAPILIRFYAANPNLDAHGEVDVWLDTDGTFPASLKIDEYRALISDGSSYRKTAEIGDTPRNSVQIASVSGVFMPGVYAASDGELRSFKSLAPTVSAESKTFVRQGTDQGLSYSIQAV